MFTNRIGFYNSSTSDFQYLQIVDIGDVTRATGVTLFQWTCVIVTPSHGQVSLVSPSHRTGVACITVPWTGVTVPWTGVPLFLRVWERKPVVSCDRLALSDAHQTSSLSVIRGFYKNSILLLLLMIVEAMVIIMNVTTIIDGHIAAAICWCCSHSTLFAGTTLIL